MVLVAVTGERLGDAARRDAYHAADFAVLMEPSNGVVEAGCQGTMRVDVRTTGTRSHSARSWMGHNAIHDAGEVLRRLSAYEPRQVEIDGLGTLRNPVADEPA